MMQPIPPHDEPMFTRWTLEGTWSNEAQQAPTADDLQRLAEELRAGGSDPNVIRLHPEAAAFILEIERRRQHWYWRLWWRIRYAPADVRDWLRRRG